MEKQLDLPIKLLQFDRGGEYLLDEFVHHLLENGIVSQLTTPRTLGQNGVAEKKK